VFRCKLTAKNNRKPQQQQHIEIAVKYPLDRLDKKTILLDKMILKQSRTNLKEFLFDMLATIYRQPDRHGISYRFLYRRVDAAVHQH